ncbi:MAG: D-Ala-D-Ala carboxypeptidase family metallohydrolase [Actinomycetota bacterium]
MNWERVRRVAGTAVATAIVVTLVASPGASAKPFDRALKPGAKGRQVKKLQVRLSGWYPTKSQQRFSIDGSYGAQTRAAMQAFEAAYGRPVNGVASVKDLRIFNGLQDTDGSTKHFDYSEFDQNRSSSCSSRANSYAGTFSGGRSRPRRVKGNVKRLMWRLEAVRKKGGSKPIGINSGFRSVAYNDCIGGARASQHLYGTAADNRMTGIDNRRERRIAKRSQFHGIGCYSSLSHNHFDIRIDNRDMPAGHFWWWPRKDGQGRELADDGRPCWGESARAGAKLASATSPAVLRELRSGVLGAGSLVPTLAEIELFETSGEAEDLGGLD